MTCGRGPVMYQYKHGALSHLIDLVHRIRMSTMYIYRYSFARGSASALTNIHSTRLELWHPALSGLLCC